MFPARVGPRPCGIAQRLGSGISGAGAILSILQSAMLIPIGHEGEGLRRWPVVTLTIIALCIAMFIANIYGPQDDDDLILHRFHEAADYYLEHPELEAHPLLRYFLGETDESEVGSGRSPRDTDRTPLHRERQAHLDTLTNALIESVRVGQAGRFGWIPGETTLTRVVTHLFVHGDIFHLFFNMLFLYLSAPLIEDVWGRSFFAAFYVLSGFAAAGLFSEHHPIPIPLIGASGAISAVMGAMLVRRPNARIRMLWWWNFSFQRFPAPAWTLLAASAVHDLVTAYRMDQIMPGGGSVAHWAHVYGFGFGMLVACVVRFLGLERILVRRPGVDADHGVLRKVDEALVGNRYEEGWTRLTQHLSRVPDDRDAGLVYWDLARRLGRCDLAAPVLLRIIRMELDLGHDAAGLAHWADLRAHAQGVVVDVDLILRVAAVLAEGGADGEAEDLVRDAASRVSSTTPVATLGRLTRVARLFSGHVEAQIAKLVRANPAYRPQ